LCPARARNSNEGVSPKVFKAALETILERTEGSLGALIMGTDGIAVEQVINATALDRNLDVIATEVTSLVRAAQRMGRDVDLGGAREMMFAYDNAVIVVRALNSDYFIALALDADSQLGRGRFELRKAEFDFASEFVV